MSANIFKVGSIWHYRFQVAGARVQKSTRLRNRSKAETYANEAFAVAVVRANGGLPVPTLAELAQDWLVVHRPTVSAAHYSSVETCARLHFYDLANKPIGDITTEHVEAARNLHLVDHRPSSANHWLRVIKLLTMWAVRRGILANSPWKVKTIKVQKAPRVTLPVDIALAWFGAIDNATAREPGVGTAVRLMFGLGLRAGESTSARWEWVDWNRKTYTPGITKGREAEPVPMAGWLIDYLQPMSQAAGLIACQADGSAFPEGFAKRAIKAANATCKTKGITPHRLRGTFATLLSEAGVPIQTIQKVMRHKSFITTMGYLEKNLDTAAQAQERIGGIIGFKRRESGEGHQTAPINSTV
ncbi:MAG TPA: tyrosine-type recombinase/integrase [Telluria sp.]|jgi:integrase